MKKEKLLLHACCGPCSTHVINELSSKYELTIYFFDPNIHPEQEYEKRLIEAKKVAEKLGIELIEGKYDTKQWFEKTNGYEKEPEGGKRCTLCYEIRLRSTVELAKQKGFKIFASTLTVSPYQDAKIINQIGSRLGKQFKIHYLESNFKKKDGYLKSIKLSKEMGLYRQEYCGCIYSLKQKQNQLRNKTIESPKEKK